jgi:hypothetical protein
MTTACPVAASILVLSIVTILSAAEGVKTEEAAAAFEKVYGGDLKRAKGARDSVELADRMVKAARDPDCQAEYLNLLCEKAYELTQPHPEGAKTAVEAMRLLANRVPEKAAACAESIAKIRQKQFDLSKGEAKTRAGEDLIDALLEAVDAKFAAGAYTDALTLCKRAQPVARAIKSVQADKVDARLKAVGMCMKSVRDAEDLRKKVEKEPDNKTLREKLVRLYLVELDNPTEANKYVEGLDDGDLRKYVPAAAKPLESAPAMACLELGDWYYTKLFNDASAGAKSMMFERAQGYYERFLDTHSAKDMDRKRATDALKTIEAELEKMASSALHKQPPIIDLLAWIDPARAWIDAAQAVLGWKRQGQALVGGGSGEWCLTFPVILDGSYELQMTLVRIGKENSIVIVLPIRATLAELVLNVDGRPKFRLEDVVGGCPEGAMESLADNREHSLKARVLLKGDRADLVFNLDGEPLFKWSGPISALAEHPNRLSHKQCPGLRLYGCQVSLRSLRLRVLSGEPKPLYPAERPKAIPPTR